jgi:fructose-1,6-bisphosphatase
MEIDPEHIHQRTPFAVGSKHEVELYEACFRENRLV